MGAGGGDDDLTLYLAWCRWLAKESANGTLDVEISNSNPFINSHDRYGAQLPAPSQDGSGAGSMEGLSRGGGGGGGGGVGGAVEQSVKSLPAMTLQQQLESSPGVWYP